MTAPVKHEALVMACALGAHAIMMTGPQRWPKFGAVNHDKCPNKAFMLSTKMWMPYLTELQTHCCCSVLWI